MATPEGHADPPYPLYRRLQAAAPVHRSVLDGNWYVSGFDACRVILGDARMGKDDQFVVPRHGVDPERVRWRSGGAGPRCSPPTRLSTSGCGGRPRGHSSRRRCRPSNRE